MVSIWFLYVSLCYLCMPCFKRSSSSLQYISLFFFQVLGHPPVIKQSTGKPPFVNDFPISTSIYLYIYGFSIAMFDDQNAVLFAFLGRKHEKNISPTTYPRKFHNRKVANAPLLHDISMVDRFKPRYLGTHSKTGQP